MSDLSVSHAAPAARTRAIEPFYAVDVFREALALEAKGHDVIKLSLGEPDFHTPERVARAAADAVARGETHYTLPFGIWPLREALAADYAKRYGVDISPERIGVTVGGSGALTFVFGALVDPGDEILMADPTYPSNRAWVHLYGGIVKSIPVDATTRYQPTAEQIAEQWGPRTRGVMLASPGNPTGTIVPRDELERILGVVRRHGGVLIVDEIYLALTYGIEPHTALACGEDVIVVNSFSKYYGMTGWRLGWVVASREWIAPIHRIAEHLQLAPPTPAQFAALAALEEESTAIYETHRAEYQRRRDWLLPQLRQLGFTIPIVPDGAFYIYAGCERFSDDSWDFAMRLLHEAHVAVTPGRDFGQHQARTHVRFAYTVPRERLEEAVRRVGEFTARLRG